MSDEKRSRFQRYADSAVATAVGALVVGFFIFLWETSMTLKDGLSKAQDYMKDTNAKVLASQEVVSEEIAKLRTGLRRLEEQVKKGGISIEKPKTTPGALPSALRMQRDIQDQFREQFMKKKEMLK